MIKKIILISFCFLLFKTVFADNEISVVFEPKNPKPYSQVKISLISYAYDLNTLLITWESGGKIISKGFGNKTIKVSTQGSGSSSEIKVTVSTPEGDLASLFYVKPSNVDLIYESLESYTPIFYEGKALPGEGSSIKVFAIPSFSSKNISYLWYVNDEYIESASGNNKNTLVTKLDYLRDSTTIKVKVRDESGNESDNSIDIYPHSPMPLFYFEDDILGTVRSRAIENRLEATTDFNLILSPYFLSTKGQPAGFDSYTWTLGGRSLFPEDNLRISFQPKKDSYGENTLSVLISNTKRRLQTAEINLNMVFDTRK